jgi:hypothetical protein
MDCLLVCGEVMEMVFDYGAARFLVCALYFLFIYCYLVKCGCCWQIAWSFAVKVMDKWNYLNKLSILCLLHLVWVFNVLVKIC